MIKVDVVVKESFHSITGVNQVLLREVNNHDFFLENGIETTTFTLDSISNQQADNFPKLTDLKIIKRIKSLARYLGLHFWPYAAIRFQIIVWSSRRIVKYYHSLSRTPDILVFHSIYDCYAYIKMYGKENKRIIQFIHADSAKGKMIMTYFPVLKGTLAQEKIERISDYVINNIDRVVCISSLNAKSILKEYPKIETKLSIAVNGIEDLTEDKKIFIKTKKELEYPIKYRLVCSGSINGRKGQWLILQALTKIRPEQLNQIHLTLIGDGPERISLENYVKNNFLNNHVTFTGAIKNDLVFDYLSDSNIYILMSDSEGLPISIIEALRCGLAVIATNVSGIPETVDDKVNGLLINRSLNDLVNVLDNLDSYDWISMSKKSRSKYENMFTYDRMKQDYVKIIKNVYKYDHN